MQLIIITILCLTMSNISFAYEAGVRPPAGINNVWFEYNKSDTVFIFVHGILSDSRDAWYFPGDSNNPSSYWPKFVANESFGNPSIFLGGFYTVKLSGDYTIPDAAEELYSYLSVSQPPSSTPVLAKKNIIFIAHSLGGIAVRYLLTKKREAFDGKFVGLVLVASPSLGSKDADRLSFILDLVNQKMGQQLKWKDPSLVELDRDFRNLVDANRNRSLVGIELVENHFYSKFLWLFRQKVLVPEESGGRYFGVPLRIGGSDHSSIAKPKKPSSRTHVALRQFYEQKFLPLLSDAVPTDELIATLKARANQIIDRLDQDVRNIDKAAYEATKDMSSFSGEKKLFADENEALSSNPFTLPEEDLSESEVYQRVMKETWDINNEIRALKEKFIELHKKHIGALQQNNFLLAHEYLNQILVLLREEYPRITAQNVGVSPGTYATGFKHTLVETRMITSSYENLSELYDEQRMLISGESPNNQVNKDTPR